MVSHHAQLNSQFYKSKSASFLILRPLESTPALLDIPPPLFAPHLDHQLSHSLFHYNKKWGNTPHISTAGLAPNAIIVSNYLIKSRILLLFVIIFNFLRRFELSNSRCNSAKHFF